MKQLFDISSALEQLEYFKDTESLFAEKYACLSNDQIREPMYLRFCSRLEYAALSLRVIQASNSEIVSKIYKAAECFIPYFKGQMDRWDIQKHYKGHDFRAVADYHFANVFALFVATQPFDEVLSLCNETNYGPYMGRTDLNSVEGIYCRIIRATYTKDHDWLDRELQELQVRARETDPVHPSFGISPILLHELFTSIFANDKILLNKSIKKSVKWYSQRVRKGHSTSDGLKYYVSINGLLLSMYKIAVGLHGLEIQLEDPFLPMDIVCLE